jgi:hypothetical protein
MKFSRSVLFAAVLGTGAYACHHDASPGTTPAPQMAPSTGDPGSLPDPNTPGAVPGPQSPGTPSAGPMAPGAPGPTGPLAPGTTTPTSPGGTTAPGPTVPSTNPTTMGDAGSTRPPGSTGATNSDRGTPANRGGGAVGSTAEAMNAGLVQLASNENPVLPTLPGPGDATAMAGDGGVSVTAPRDGGMPGPGGDAGVPTRPRNPPPPGSPNPPGGGSGSGINPPPPPPPGGGSGSAMNPARPR